MKNLKIHPPSNFYAEVAIKSSLIRASLALVENLYAPDFQLFGYIKGDF